jgi:hypothetical protein
VGPSGLNHHSEPRGHRLLRLLETVSEADPAMLIMDQKVTTQAILGGRGVKFATLRMRSPDVTSPVGGGTAPLIEIPV